MSREGLGRSPGESQHSVVEVGKLGLEAEEGLLKSRKEDNTEYEREK